VPVVPAVVAAMDGLKDRKDVVAAGLACLLALLPDFPKVLRDGGAGPAVTYAASRYPDLAPRCDPLLSMLRAGGSGRASGVASGGAGSGAGSGAAGRGGSRDSDLRFEPEDEDWAGRRTRRGGGGGSAGASAGAGPGPYVALLGDSVQGRGGQVPVASFQTKVGSLFGVPRLCAQPVLPLLRCSSHVLWTALL
jgi:hypothetical protein